MVKWRQLPLLQAIKNSISWCVNVSDLPASHQTLVLHCGGRSSDRLGVNNPHPLVGGVCRCPKGVILATSSSWYQVHILYIGTKVSAPNLMHQKKDTKNHWEYWLPKQPQAARVAPLLKGPAAAPWVESHYYDRSWYTFQERIVLKQGPPFWQDFQMQDR